VHPSFSIFRPKDFAAVALLLLLVVALCRVSIAQDEPVTLFPHSENSRWWVSGQSNIIFQAHPEFHAAYSGPSSLQPAAEQVTYHVNTVYLGYQFPRGAETLFNFEWADGQGLSEAAGLAGGTNADVPRDTASGAPPRYVIRGQFHQTLRLSADDMPATRGPMALATKVPARRLEFRIGSINPPDFFDLNGVGGDTHLQFLNWTVVNNGAWDYTGHTRGYTYGILAEYQSRRWGFRFAETLMAKEANGYRLDWDLRRARSETYELELRPALLKDRLSIVRLLAFENHANMGDYRAAVARYLANQDSRPIIENTRAQSTVKYGFGVNAEQELPHDLRVFLRLGWNEGRHESYAYTEVNSTFSAGADLAGGLWHRALDKIGAALVTNGISADHQNYLRYGGIGILLGDNPSYPAGAPAGNALRYGRETIFEAYYNAHLWRGVFLAGDIQRIWNPGYNRDRGPVLVPGVRLHIDY
jgi:high affinity Mn2+ porin